MLERIDVLQRGVAHAEPGADMFAEQFGGRAVSLAVALDQVADRLDEKPLAVEITGIVVTDTNPSTGIRTCRNDDNFGMRHLGFNPSLGKTLIILPSVVTQGKSFR